MSRQWRVMARASVLALPLALLANGLRGQEPPETAAFLAAVERSGERLADYRNAISEGYRKLGPDFPGMGEHWINPGLVIDGALDPDYPPVLCYTEVRGARRLVGVAYTRVLAPGEDLPTEGPFPVAAWHDHTGEVDEESLLLVGPASMHSGGDGYRLAMVHVWMPESNPDGVFAQNNWTLPFTRAGLSTDHVSHDAARALSLAEGGTEFYALLLRQGLELRGPGFDAAIGAFERTSQQVDEWLAREEREGDLAEGSIDALERLWAGLWRELRAVLSDDVFEKVAILR